jgi:hypothetical protein
LVPVAAGEGDGGAGVDESLAVVGPEGPEGEGGVVAEPEGGSGIEADSSALVDWGADSLRRKMPLSPSETGGAGLEDRFRFALSAGATVTMIRLPSTVIV